MARVCGLTEVVTGEKAAPCRRKDICVTRGSQPGRAVKDVQEQLDDGERDAQTCSQIISRAVSAQREHNQEGSGRLSPDHEEQ